MIRSSGLGTQVPTSSKKTLNQKSEDPGHIHASSPHRVHTFSLICQSGSPAWWRRSTVLPQGGSLLGPGSEGNPHPNRSM